MTTLRAKWFYRERLIPLLPFSLGMGFSDPQLDLQPQTPPDPPAHAATVLRLAYSAEASILASRSYDRSIRVWDLQTGSLQATLLGHGGRGLTRSR